MLQDRFPELIKSTYNFRILVHANQRAKKSLINQGITPAIFVHHFYQNNISHRNLQISYELKDKITKPIGQIIPIDYDEYSCYKKDIVHSKISRNLLETPIKYQQNISKNTFQERARIEHHLNNLNFLWFDQACRNYLYSFTIDPSSFQIQTIHQPYATVFIIEVDQLQCKLHYKKLKEQTDEKIKNMYTLNNWHIKDIPQCIIILYDRQKNISKQQAEMYTLTLCNQCYINKDSILQIQINSPDSQNESIWSKYRTSVLHYNYNRQSKEGLKLLNVKDLHKINKHIEENKELIKRSIQKRINTLINEYDKINTTRNKFMNFFKSNTPNDKSYTIQEKQIRQLADLLFLLEDYKQAYDLYRSLGDKINQRSRKIQSNITYMSQICLCMSKFHYIKIKSDPFSIIEREADHTLDLFDNSEQNIIRYLIFLMYSMHVFKGFKENFLNKNYEKKVKSALHRQKGLTGCLIPLLLYEQCASLHLLVQQINYRSYCYDLVMVATKFNQFKLYNHSMRCYLLVQSIYENSFNPLEKYIYLQIASTFCNTQKFDKALKYIRKAWKKFMELKTSEKQIYTSDFTSISATIQKIIDGITDKKMQLLAQPSQQLIFPQIQSINVEVQDEKIAKDYQYGIKWFQLGQKLIDSKQLSAQGTSKKYYVKLMQTFDCVNAEQKQLVHRFKAQSMNQYLMKKHTRYTYLNQIIKISFVFNNQLNYSISLDNINLHIKNKQSFKYQIIQQSHIKEGIQPLKKKRIYFIILPQTQGLFEIQSFSWTFMNIRCDYQIAQPESTQTQMKSCYYKLQVVQQVGILGAESQVLPFYYEGQVYTMKLILYNRGSQLIDYIEISLGAEENEACNLNKSLNITLEPKDYKTVELKLHIPLIPNDEKINQYKMVQKIIFLYRSKNHFRTTRIINQLHISRVSRLSQPSCERLSTHLHLLTFTLSKQLSNSHKILSEIIIKKDFEIAKVQQSQQSDKFLFYMFLRKNKGLGKRIHYLHQNNVFMNVSEEISQQGVQSNINSDDNCIEIIVIWNEEKRYGYIQPLKKIQILNAIIKNDSTNNKNLSLPFNFKINYQAEISHCFKKNPILNMPITIKIKNIFYNEIVNINIYFTQQIAIKTTWLGIVEHKFNLKYNQQVIINVNLLIFQSGIYDISNNIKYIVKLQYMKQYIITHSSFQAIYISIKDKQETLQMKKPKQNQAHYSTIDLL